MTFYECRVCGKLLSPKAKICCHCGAVDPRGRRKVGIIIVLGLLLLGLFLAMKP